jgi:hypothetical protein
MLNIPGCQPYVEARSVLRQDLSVSIQNEPPASLLYVKAKVIAFGEVLIPIALQNLQLPESEQQKEECPYGQEVKKPNPALQVKLGLEGRIRARHITPPSVPSIFGRRKRTKNPRER